MQSTSDFILALTDATAQVGAGNRSLREDGIADVGLGHPQMRRMLGELGRRLVEGGAIPGADDIYWLELNELDESARQLEKGERLESFATQIKQCKAKWEAMRHITPPTTLPKVGWLSKFYADNEQTGDKIKGFAASADTIYP